MGCKIIPRGTDFYQDRWYSEKLKYHLTRCRVLTGELIFSLRNYSLAVAMGLLIYLVSGFDLFVFLVIVLVKRKGGTETLPNWTRKSNRRRTLREIWEMNSRLSQSAWTAIPTFTALDIPPARAIGNFGFGYCSSLIFSFAYSDPFCVC